MVLCLSSMALRRPRQLGAGDWDGTRVGATNNRTRVWAGHLLRGFVLEISQVELALATISESFGTAWG